MSHVDGGGYSVDSSLLLPEILVSNVDPRLPLSRLAALSPAVEAAAVAVVVAVVAVVVTVTQGVDPQDPPTHSQYDFTLNEFYLNVHISWIYSGFQNAFDALSLSFAVFVVVVVIGSIHFLEQHLTETRTLTR